MKSREIIKRLMLIIQLLRTRGSASYKDIEQYLDEKSNLDSYNYRTSKRSFARDIEDISFLFKIEIEYDYHLRAYVIAQDDNEDITERMVEAFDIFNALSIKEHLSDCVHIKERNPLGTEYLYSLIKAIKEQKEVSFQYAKFGTNELTQRTIQPYGVKEFRNWWFLLGKEHENGILKSFGFDRIRNLEITEKNFEKDPNFNIQTYYKHAFGATVLDNKPPQEIILAITGEEINYAKVMPFHASQVILEDTLERLLIKLNVYITWELVAELRGKIPYIEIISPKELKEKILSFKYFDQF